MALTMGRTLLPGLKPFLNKTLPHAHAKAEFDVLGVFKKLVKYVVHLLKEKNWKILLFFTQAAQIAID